MHKTLVRIAFASAALLAASASAQDIQRDRPVEQQDDRQQRTQAQQAPEQPSQPTERQGQPADGQQQPAHDPQRQAQQGAQAEPFQGDLDDLAEENDDFRRVLHTGKEMQLVVMSIAPGDELGLEAHPVEQCLYIVDGTARAVVAGRTSHLTSGGMVCIPNGAEHNVFNTGDEPLKLFTVYSPPEHADGTVHATRAEAEQAERESPA